MCYLIDLWEKMCQLVQQWHDYLGVTKNFLIPPTGGNRCLVKSWGRHKSNGEAVAAVLLNGRDALSHCLLNTPVHPASSW